MRGWNEIRSRISDSIREMKHAAPKGSGRRLSYMKRYFLKMLLLIIILVGVLVFMMTRFSKSVVGDEIISLHRSILNQTIRQPAETIRSLKESLEKITENTRVIDWIVGGEGDTEEIDAYIRAEIYGNYKKGNKFRIYIYDLDELRYASDSPELPEEEAREALKQAALLEQKNPKDNRYLGGPLQSGQEQGLYRHSFYLTQPIKDLLSGSVRGYALMQFSEVVLYDSYSDMIEKDRDYCIVDAEGIVLSGKNKNHIGLPYQKNDIVIENREALGSGYGISKAFPDNVYFYENISGTEWFLLENADIHHLFAPIDRMTFFSFLLLAVFAVCFLPVTAVSLRVILKPIDAIKNKMDMVARGELQARIEEAEKGKGELSEIADSFNYMVGKLESQVDEIGVMERKKHLLQLDFLQTQINPHFIYNTLSSIRFYVEMGKNEAAEKMLIDFSKILRKTLSSSEKMISLREERETLLYYIDLQKARYRDRFEVEFDMPENTLSCIVPDFILQPIVENAIFYSLQKKQVCHIVIRSYLDPDVHLTESNFQTRPRTLCISVKDDGIGMDEDKLSTVLDKGMNMNKVGLRNVNERLKLNFGEEYGIRILSEEGVGTEVILSMPVNMRGKNLDENTDSGR